MSSKHFVLSAALVIAWVLPSNCGVAQVEAPAPAPGRILEVDRLGTTPYKTLTAAAKAAGPGDTIKVKPNSGPYREVLQIKTSGTVDRPIIFEGGGNLVTAFEPLTTWQEKDGAVSCAVKFPCVLTYKGERLIQDYTTGKFTKYADLNEAQDTLTLRPGTDKDGWEISRRAFAVSVNDVSHHIYRNVRASGSTNDGFNLHGTGTDLVFENIEAFHNLDEGYSSHDSIQGLIRNSRFWGNDNGIANYYINKDTVSTILENVDLRDNLGFGLVLHDCAASLKNVRSWNNGVLQINLNNAVITSDNVRAYKPGFQTRPWRSYTESKTSNVNTPHITSRVERTTVSGTPITIEALPAPPTGN